VITKWNLEPKVSEAMFRFSPPPGARKVDFLPAGTR
jgi:hypothetical protein